MTSPRTGYEDFAACLRALPKRYSELVAVHLARARRDHRQGARAFGPRIETVVRDILELEGLNPTRPGPVYPDEGYVRPDIFVAPLAFIEVTKWSDTNKLASMLANGMLIKRRKPDVRYYTVIAGLGAADTWSDEESVKFYFGRDNQVGNVPIVDGYFGFKNIDRLVAVLKRKT